MFRSLRPFIPRTIRRVIGAQRCLDTQDNVFMSDAAPDKDPTTNRRKPKHYESCGVGRTHRRAK